MGIRIDELDPEIAATLEHVLAAMEDGDTIQLTVKQILDLFILYPEFIAKADTTAVTTAIANAMTQVRTRYKVRAATTGNVTIATALNAGDTIDGVVLAAGDLVLVKSQTAAEQNGVYVVGAVPARAPEFATYNDHSGAMIAVVSGTVNAAQIFHGYSALGGTLNTTAIQFTVHENVVPQKTVPVSADRLALLDSVTGLLRTLPLANLGRVGRIAIKTFFASGTYTPDPNLLFAVVEAQGAGGGGGGVAGNGANYMGGGGGASGGYSRSVLTKAQIGASQAVTIGTGGGGGGSAPSNGAAGGNTSVGSLLVALGGGGGGGGGPSNAPGAGLPANIVSAVGDVKILGEPGNGGVYGGGGATPTGYGGSGVFGSGGYGVVQTANGATFTGNQGSNGGGGSGGAANAAAGGNTGGAGGNGLVIITEFCSE